MFRYKGVNMTSKINISKIISTLESINNHYGDHKFDGHIRMFKQLDHKLLDLEQSYSQELSIAKHELCITDGNNVVRIQDRYIHILVLKIDFLEDLLAILYEHIASY